MIALDKKVLEGIYKYVLLGRSTPPCPDGGKPSLCADGSTPTGGRPGGRPGGRCPKEQRICCDGSTPTFDGDRATPPCADGTKPKCNQDDC